MNTIKKSELKNNVVRYTVKLNNLENGTITNVNCAEEIKIGDFKNNVQFVDEFGNKMGKNGAVLEIIKTEIYTTEGFQSAVITD